MKRSQSIDNFGFLLGKDFGTALSDCIKNFDISISGLLILHIVVQLSDSLLPTSRTILELLSRTVEDLFSVLHILSSQLKLRLALGFLVGVKLIVPDLLLVNRSTKAVEVDYNCIEGASCLQ